MKLQLINQKDPDGNWYVVTKDDRKVKFISITPGKEEEALAEAQEYFERIRDNSITSTVIREEEI